MTLVYSPYLRRYVRRLASQTGSSHGVRIRSFASPLVAQGDLVSYVFPSTAEVGKEAPWSCDVHNAGTDGVVGFGIVNNAGNPGNIVVRWGGKDDTLEPGYYWKGYTANPVPNCSHLVIGGQVVFQAEGSHTVRLWAMHQEGATWFYDEEVTCTVNVVPSGYKVKTVTVLSDKQINVPFLWDGNSDTETINFKWDSARTTITRVTLQARAYSDSDAMQMDFYMNAAKVGDVSWPALQSNQWKENTMDATSRLANGDNSFKFDYYFTFIGGRGANAWVYADLIIEYTGDEPTSTPTGVSFWEWVQKNWVWVAGGGFVVGSVLLLTRKGAPTFVVQVPQIQYRRREEEE